MNNINEILINFCNDLINVLVFNIGSKYDVTKTIFADIKQNGLISINSAEYLDYLDKGRKRGLKRIPYLVILRWIKKKGIRSKMSQNQLAWVIQKSIYRVGIKPRNFIARTLKSINKLYIDNVETGVNELIDNIMKTFSSTVVKSNNLIIKNQKTK